LFLLFHSVLVVEVVTCAEQNETDDYADDGRSFRLVWLFLLFDGFCLRLSCLRLRLLLCCDGFQLCSTFRAFALGLEAIASATGTLPQVARDVCATMRTSASHCGDLATTFRTFDDAHVNKAQRDTGFLRPCPFASHMKVKLTLQSSPLLLEPRPLLRREFPLRRELPPQQEFLLFLPFWASSLRELPLQESQACPFRLLR